MSRSGSSRTGLLTTAEFHRLADVLPEVQWFANLIGPSTRRTYKNAVRDFVGFSRITRYGNRHTTTARSATPNAATSIGLPGTMNT
jgi:hypothetical protein